MRAIATRPFSYWNSLIGNQKYTCISWKIEKIQWFDDKACQASQTEHRYFIAVIKLHIFCSKQLTNWVITGLTSGGTSLESKLTRPFLLGNES